MQGFLVIDDKSHHEELMTDKILENCTYIRKIRLAWRKTPEYSEIINATQPARKKGNSELIIRKIAFALFVILLLPTLLLPFGLVCIRADFCTTCLGK